MNYPLGDWLHNKISRQEYKEKMAIYRDKQSQYVAKRLFEIAQKYKPNYGSRWTMPRIKVYTLYLKNRAEPISSSAIEIGRVTYAVAI